MTWLAIITSNPLSAWTCNKQSVSVSAIRQEYTFWQKYLGSLNLVIQAPITHSKEPSLLHKSNKARSQHKRLGSHRNTRQVELARKVHRALGAATREIMSDPASLNLLSSRDRVYPRTKLSRRGPSLELRLESRAITAAIGLSSSRR